MAEISPTSSRSPSPARLAADDTEPSAPSLATEAAQIARAAAERAAQLADDHWSTAGPTQASVSAHFTCAGEGDGLDSAHVQRRTGASVDDSQQKEYLLPV